MLISRDGGLKISDETRYMLIVPAEQAEGWLSEVIQSGTDILASVDDSQSSFEEAMYSATLWRERVKELLSRIFDVDSVRERYRRMGRRTLTDNENMQVKKEVFCSGIKLQIIFLSSLLERLDLIPQINTMPNEVAKPEPVPSVSSVFVVHGHDGEAKQSVARFIEQLKIEAIILHERPSQGKTIVEKLEHYSNVGFAVVLLTPDDVGASKNNAEHLNARARQNVVLELGLFIGKLGRNRVCAIVKGDLELPGDYDGVVYLPMDESEAWKLSLAREMKLAGYSIDMNILVN